MADVEKYPTVVLVAFVVIGLIVLRWQLADAPSTRALVAGWARLPFRPAFPHRGAIDDKTLVTAFDKEVQFCTSLG